MKQFVLLIARELNDIVEYVEIGSDSMKTGLGSIETVIDEPYARIWVSSVSPQSFYRSVYIVHRLRLGEITEWLTNLYRSYREKIYPVEQELRKIRETVTDMLMDTGFPIILVSSYIEVDRDGSISGYRLDIVIPYRVPINEQYVRGTGYTLSVYTTSVNTKISIKVTGLFDENELVKTIRKISGMITRNR